MSVTFSFLSHSPRNTFYIITLMSKEDTAKPTDVVVHSTTAVVHSTTADANKKLNDNLNLIFKELSDEESVATGIRFYQYVSSVLEFASSDYGYNRFFEGLSTSERQTQLRKLLIRGNKEFFNGNPTNLEWINNIFNSKTTAGTISSVVLQFMILVQEDSRTGTRVSADRKLSFVKNSIVSFLRFADLEDSEKQLIIVGLDTLIQGFIMVKNGALAHIVDVEEVKEILDNVNEKCCTGKCNIM